MAGLSATTPPVAEPISLAEAKLHLRVDITDDDDLIRLLISTARAHTEDYTNRQLLTATWTETLDAWPVGGRVILSRSPLQSIASISYVDTNGDTQPWDLSNYEAETTSYVSSFRRAYGVSWPSVRAYPDAVTVVYVAGYGDDGSDVPEPIRQSMLLMVGHWYEHREWVSDGFPLRHTPKAVETLLASYRVRY